MQPASTQPKHSATSKRRLPADGSAQAVDRDERRPLSVTGAVTARAKGLPPRLRKVLERGRRLVGAALRPGHRAALAAGVGCAAYGALKLYWALGGELLMRQAPLTADQRRHLLEGTARSTWRTGPRSRWRRSASPWRSPPFATGGCRGCSWSACQR
jgi:hypothetical protein